MKNYTAENFVEHLKKIDFPNYKTYSCMNMAYLDFTTKFIDSLCPSKKIRIKGNTKYWFDSEVIVIVNKCNACYKKFKLSGLERDKDILRLTKQFLKSTIQKKKKMFFQDKSWKILKIR